MLCLSIGDGDFVVIPRRDGSKLNPILLGQFGEIQMFLIMQVEERCGDESACIRSSNYVSSSTALELALVRVRGADIQWVQWDIVSPAVVSRYIQLRWNWINIDRGDMVQLVQMNKSQSFYI